MKRILAMILTVAMLFTLSACGDARDVRREGKAKTPKLEGIDKDLDSYGFMEEDRKAFKETLESCGVELKHVSKADDAITDGMEEFAGMDAFTGKISDDVSIFITTSDRTITSVIVQMYNFIDGTTMEPLYNSIDGEVLKRFDELEIPDTKVESSAETVLQIITEDVAARIAKNPSTVKFKLMSWAFAKKDNIYEAQGVFECSNLLGVKEEHTINVRCEADFENNKMYPKYALLDGVKVWTNR